MSRSHAPVLSGVSTTVANRDFTVKSKSVWQSVAAVLGMGKPLELVPAVAKRLAHVAAFAVRAACTCRGHHGAAQHAASALAVAKRLASVLTVAKRLAVVVAITALLALVLTAARMRTSVQWRGQVALVCLSCRLMLTTV